MLSPKQKVPAIALKEEEEDSGTVKMTYAEAN